MEAFFGLKNVTVNSEEILLNGVAGELPKNCGLIVINL